MKKYKVLIDSNILVSASIFYTSEDLNVKVSHKFYKNCKTLINLFKKRIDNKIGYIPY